jgi:hypothetical protein
MHGVSQGATMAVSIVAIEIRDRGGCRRLIGVCNDLWCVVCRLHLLSFEVLVI